MWILPFSSINLILDAPLNYVFTSVFAKASLKAKPYDDPLVRAGRSVGHSTLTVNVKYNPIVMPVQSKAAVPVITTADLWFITLCRCAICCLIQLHQHDHHLLRADPHACNHACAPACVSPEVRIRHVILQIMRATFTSYLTGGQDRPIPLRTFNEGKLVLPWPITKCYIRRWMSG